VDISSLPSHPVLFIDATTDPMCPSFPDSQVILYCDEWQSISDSPPQQSQSTYKTRQFDRMLKNIGAKVLRVFFINGTPGSLDFFEGTVRSITFTNKYDTVYDDNDSEEMSEPEFAHFSLPPKAQDKAHVARLEGDQWLKELSSCNCAEGHCYHPWAKHTPLISVHLITKQLLRNLDSEIRHFRREDEIPIQAASFDSRILCSMSLS
jgi:hypothetical protein